MTRLPNLLNDGFERRWMFRPAYDHTDQPNGGWGAMKAFAALIGPKGAVTLTIDTGWALLSSQKRMEMLGWARRDPDIWKGNGMAVGFHHRKDPGHPLGDPKDCDWLEGECYFDVGYTIADEVFERFVGEGEQGLWVALREWYDKEIAK